LNVSDPLNRGPRPPFLCQQQTPELLSAQMKEAASIGGLFHFGCRGTR
jgi:hypothetical protein